MVITDTKEKTVQNIMNQLNGLSYEEAASILQAVAVELTRSLKVILCEVEQESSDKAKDTH